MSVVIVLFFAAIIGTVAAIAGIVFIEGVNFFAALDKGSGWVFLLPVAAGYCLAIISRFLPERHFLGMADIVLLVQRDIYHRFRSGVMATVASFIALVSGASVGQYGAIAYLGGLLGVSGRWKLPSGTAAACGVAAAIAAAFNAPVAGIVFVHEVILRHYSLRTFTPIAVAAVVGYSVSVGLFARPVFLQVEGMAVLHPLMVVMFVLLGVVCGVLAVGYLRGIFYLADKTAKVSLFFRLPFAGLVAGGLLVVVPELLGGDKSLLEAITSGLPSVAVVGVVVILLAKTVATMVCLGGGFAGGVVSPTFVIGALTGVLFFRAMDGVLDFLPFALPVSVVVLCGMMAMTAPVLGAPLAGILLVMELSGNYLISVFAVVSVAVAMQVAARLGGRSYYEEQLLRRGFELRQRRDDWLLQKTTVRKLAVSAAVVLPSTARATEAVRLAAEKSATEIYLVDDGRYVGRLSLSVAVVAGDEPLSAKVKPLPVLLAEDSVDSAIQKISTQQGSELPVVEEDGRWVGVVGKGDLLRFHTRLVRESRDEESAV